MKVDWLLSGTEMSVSFCEGAWSRIGVHGAVTIAMESFSRYHLSTNQSFRYKLSNASSFLYTHKGK